MKTINNNIETIILSENEMQNVSAGTGAIAICARLTGAIKLVGNIVRTGFDELL